MVWNDDVNNGEHHSVIDPTYSQPIEKVVALRGLFLEDADVLEDLVGHRNAIVVTNRVLAEEIEDDGVGRAERDVLELQRAAADCVCLVFTLLVAGSEGELIDEVDGGCSLACCHLLT